ncbi:MAG: WD40/YVTN/BNR-like repeat-containing protein [Planctomycetota bacterium]|jgi:photosystem II stability/assembly factor-like uncharacterized protein
MNPQTVTPWLILLLALNAPANLAAQSDAETEPATEVADAADEVESETEEEAEEEDGLRRDQIGALKLRSIGPALMSGRIADIVVDPTRPNIWYVAAGSGGIWKTTNAGTTWTPIFDDQGSYSIGCLTLDPSNAETLWVGSGENVGGRHVGYGDGVYVSHDAGRSFKNVGLKGTEHISKIVVHPDDSRTVFVAAQGPLWSPGGERGLYKTTDGGATWTQLLAAGEYTGVTDVVMDPRNPDVLYAATHQRHRTVWALMNGGPESGIHKSIDGGATWEKLGNGLPGGDVGKISLAISPQRPDVVYATIELPGRKGGFWRSANAGMRWEKRSDYISGGTGPHYYQEIWADPHRFDCIYQANVRLGRSEDGGRTWDSVAKETKHVDNHAVAFSPTDPDLVIVGCDGGLYRSWDRCETYDFCANLPLTQFYKVDVSYEWPVYHVVGGTQDNNTQYGPVRTLNNSGIRNADWRITIGGDGHDCAIDPEDPDIMYCESQEGFLRRFDRRTGQSVDIRPQPEKGEESLRFNWDSPIHISPHDHKRVYFGSKMVHRTDDRGDSWRTISGDLSRNQDRLGLEIMGRKWSLDATWDMYAMSRYGNVTSISESPIQEGLIYAGTDDGLIQVTEDGGETWRATENIPGVPATFFVNDIKADLHDVDTVYAAVDNHKYGDLQPYLLKSTDRGRTWTSMNGNLPERHLVWRIIQDHVDPSLFFLGTEFGLFCTVDAGEHWVKLGGAPVIPFRDLEIQRRENDLVGATFGRGFYVLDDYSPLRHVAGDALEVEFRMFPIKTAISYVPQRLLGGRAGSQGDAYYSADNPPYGAVFTYFLKEGFQTKAEVRKEAEKEARKAGEDTPYPGWDVIAEEEREEQVALFLEIRAEDGSLVNRIEGKAAKGMHRTAWDLRYAGFSADGGPGPRAPAGTYSVQAFLREDRSIRSLGEPEPFEVVAYGDPTLPPMDPEALLAFQMEVGRLRASVSAAQTRLSTSMEELSQIKTMITSGRHLDRALHEEVRELELRFVDARNALSGDGLRGRYDAEDVPSLSSRLGSVMWGTMGNTNGPTKTQRRQVEIAREEYEAVYETIVTLVDQELVKLKRALDAAGAPWTPGRGIPKPN